MRRERWSAFGENARPRTAASMGRRAGLLVVGALLLLALAPAAADAEVTTLLSGPQNSLCVNPTEAQFQSIINGKPNYEGDQISHSGPFADTGSSCDQAFGEKAIQVGNPGQPADGVGGWEEGIPEADWVGPLAGGNDTGDVATSTDPKYYIYDEEVTLCANQVAGAKMTGEWMADNEAGAFINGSLLGNNPNMGNWNGPYATFSTTNLHAGVNTLQFVVINEGSITGVDFRVHVETTVPCEEGPTTAAHWLSDGQPIPEGQVEPVKTKGTLTFTYDAEVSIPCKLKDAETIVNPVGGGNGTDELTAFALSGCKAKLSPCPKGTKLEVTAGGLPWKTELTLGPPIEDRILGMKITIKCSGTVIHEYNGSLTVGIEGGALQFSHGTLTEPGGELHITGSDAMTGPKGDTTIGVAEEPTTPPPPRWYSNGELIQPGQTEPVATSGSLTLGNPEVATTCTVKDEETIVNPASGGPGVDEITSLTLSPCKTAHSPCTGKSSKEELIAVGLPWKTRLIAGPPIRDVIEGIEVDVRCNGTTIDVLTGTLEPVVGNSVLEFNESSGSLIGSAKEVVPVSGSDSLKGPKGDQTITAH